MSVKCLAQDLACQCSIAHTLVSLLDAPWAITLIGEQSALIGEQSTMSHRHFSCVYNKCSGFSHMTYHQCSTPVWGLTGFLLTGWPRLPFLIWLLFLKVSIGAHEFLEFQILGHLRYKPFLASQPLGDRIPFATTWIDSKWLRTEEQNVDLTWTETWTWLTKLITVMLPQK